MIIKKLVSNTYIGYYLNKVLGGVLGFIISAALVFGFMTIVRLLGNYEVIIPVNQMIEDSTVAKLIYDNNFPIQNHFLSLSPMFKTCSYFIKF